MASTEPASTVKSADGTSCIVATKRSGRLRSDPGFQLGIDGLVIEVIRFRSAESPWVLWRLGGLDLRGDECLALTMVVQAAGPP